MTHPQRPTRRPLPTVLRVGGALLGPALALTGLAACGSTTAATPPTGHLTVVAAENFWGSIVSQLGGSHVSVTSVISDPNTDPHEYETSINNARAFADANYVVVNGAGYDRWATKLLDANPADGRRVTTVADVVGRGGGDNPHFWYSPSLVAQVMDRVTADLTALDPAGGSYFAQRRADVQAAFAPYRGRLAAIRATYAGTPVASTESIVVYLADALGLTLISPPEFMKAVAEGTDPPVAAVAQFQDQLRTHRPRVLVYNVQTVTPTTTAVTALAAQLRIPVVGVSETLLPAGAGFQDWQSAQLARLQTALASAAATP